MAGAVLGAYVAQNYGIPNIKTLATSGKLITQGHHYEETHRKPEPEQQHRNRTVIVKLEPVLPFRKPKQEQHGNPTDTVIVQINPLHWNYWFNFNCSLHYGGHRVGRLLGSKLLSSKYQDSSNYRQVLDNPTHPYEETYRKPEQQEQPPTPVPVVIVNQPTPEPEQHRNRTVIVKLEPILPFQKPEHHGNDTDTVIVQISPMHWNLLFK
ncbi:hypothetical protein CCACVL1_24677 [Corchorus capsularis]|uniref:Uncharacterized protein n=1 Tax=Corchorus capsularis TaxID=210143 RepID=A0A1R3GNM0_COCAP|nr:hypothetical protein CCACVL1_24677 [Corchorus capsularis]